jgi:hypothetical protein
VTAASLLLGLALLTLAAVFTIWLPKRAGTT